MFTNGYLKRTSGGGECLVS